MNNNPPLTPPTGINKVYLILNNKICVSGVVNVCGLKQTS